VGSKTKLQTPVWQVQLFVVVFLTGAMLLFRIVIGFLSTRTRGCDEGLGENSRALSKKRSTEETLQRKLLIQSLKEKRLIFSVQVSTELFCIVVLLRVIGKRQCQITTIILGSCFRIATDIRLKASQ
jgi:hypothetical protein